MAGLSQVGGTFARVLSVPADGTEPAGGWRSAAIGALVVVVVGLLALGFAHAARQAPLEVLLAAGDPAGPPAIGTPEFRFTVEALSETPLVPGNRVEILSNGDETFPRLYADLRAARQSIAMEMYYGSAGAVTDSVIRILTERARAGVMVYFLYDAFGTHPPPAEARDRLKAGGGHIAAFRPFRWYEVDRVSNRAHSRAVTVDGRIGYTGGLGLDDKWLGDGHTHGAWREANARVVGPAVTQLQAAFAVEWAEATGELLTGNRFFPAPPPPLPAGALAGLLHSVPASGTSPAERALALTIAGARRTLYISNAYFLPNPSFRRLLTQAAGRGVDVRILTNSEKTDVGLTRFGGRAQYEELLGGGVRIFEYQPSMMHAKAWVADGEWSGVGTMNFDNRSLALNNETGFVVLDLRTGATMDSLFLRDLEHAREITLEDFRRRPAGDHRDSRFSAPAPQPPGRPLLRAV
jgi:cardiolipin synthase